MEAGSALALALALALAPAPATLRLNRPMTEVPVPTGPPEPVDSGGCGPCLACSPSSRVAMHPHEVHFLM
jgi:hypothetical protein